jgi:glutamyl-tRNA synthetase
MKDKVVVRFAPSPTGFLHLGSARTALFNWLYARHTGGKFILRIEDTDRVRSDDKFLAEILEDLKWMGIDWDGELTYQSRRFDVYKKEAEKLIEEGKAYREGEAIIFKVEKGEAIEIDDIIHGKITFNTEEIKDQVLMKSDGSPAYNFSCVVDDIYLGITHIVRGDDHISNTPKQVLFYRAFGAELPRFGHMPLMMGKDGSKLSKRHGAVSVEEYKGEGFLPEALVNYLILLGWYPGEGKEIIPVEEVIKRFDIKDISDVQARFDIDKLRWMNGDYIAKKEVKELVSLVRKQLAAAGMDISGKDDEYLLQLTKLYQIRIKTLREFVELTDCFFKDNFTVDEKGKAKYLDGEKNRSSLKVFADKLEEVMEFTHTGLESACRELAEKMGVKAGELIHPARMAISGKTQGAGLFEMMELLGKEKVITRMRKASV